MTHCAGLLLVTQGQLGQVLLASVRDLFEQVPLPVEILDVTRSCVPDEQVLLGRQLLDKLSPGEQAMGDVLLLCDAYGSTPGNVAAQLGQERGCPVVSGLNLPMLIRVLNYPELPVVRLAQTAVEGGQRGIVLDTIGGLR